MLWQSKRHFAAACLEDAGLHVQAHHVRFAPSYSRVRMVLAMALLDAMREHYHYVAAIGSSDDLNDQICCEKVAQLDVTIDALKAALVEERMVS